MRGSYFELSFEDRGFTATATDLDVRQLNFDVRCGGSYQRTLFDLAFTFFIRCRLAFLKPETERTIVSFFRDSGFIRGWAEVGLRPGSIIRCSSRRTADLTGLGSRRAGHAKQDEFKACFVPHGNHTKQGKGGGSPRLATCAGRPRIPGTRRIGLLSIWLLPPREPFGSY